MSNDSDPISLPSTLAVVTSSPLSTPPSTAPKSSQAKKTGESTVFPRLTRLGRATFGINTGPFANDTDWTKVDFKELKLQCQQRNIESGGSAKLLIEKLNEYRDGKRMAPVYSQAARTEVGKGTDEDGEERTRQWVANPQNTNFFRTLAKVEEAPMFIIDRYDDNYHKEAPFTKLFKVVGSTGSLYDITVSLTPNCTCPGNKFSPGCCKHVLYVLKYALRITEPLIWQRAFLKSELSQIYTNAPPLHFIKEQVSSDESLRDGKVKPIEDCVCPVCFHDCAEQENEDGVEGQNDSVAVKKRVVVCCTSCGHHVHRQCMNMYAKMKSGWGPLSCVLCDAPWTLEGDWGERGLLLDEEIKPEKKGRGGTKKKAAGPVKEQPKKKVRLADPEGDYGE